MTTIVNKIDAKKCLTMHCNVCHFNTSNKANFNKHLLTKKHKNNVSTTNVTAIATFEKTYDCEYCKKMFKDRAGRWRHEKKCIQKNEVSEKELIVMLIKHNTFLVEQNTNLVKNGLNNTNSHHTNSHNKTFNLQFFLNETCKNAMNLTDFVNSIQLQLSDLEKVGEIGYVEGISNIIINNLNELDISERPLHCADKKREVLYIKEKDKWEKENDDKKRIKKAIQCISDKNYTLLDKYKQVHPDCLEYHSKYGDKYNKLLYEALGGAGDDNSEKEKKIIKNIAKNVTIDKSNA